MMLLSSLLSPGTSLSDSEISINIVKDKKKKSKKSKRTNVKHSKKTKITLAKSDTNDSNDTKTDEEIAAIQQTRDMQIQMLSSVLYMIASRFIFSMNYTDPKILMIARLVFVCYIIASQLLLKLLKDKINDIDDNTEIPTSSFNIKDGMKMFGLGGNSMLEGLLGKTNNNDGKKTTVRDYDLAEIKKLTQGLFFEIIAASYMHFVNKAGKPLIIIPVMGLLNKIKSPMVQIHLMKYKAVGQLKRPFKAGFENILAQAQAAKTDTNTEIDSNNEIDTSNETDTNNEIEIHNDNTNNNNNDDNDDSNNSDGSNEIDNNDISNDDNDNNSNTDTNNDDDIIANDNDVDLIASSRTDN